MKFLIVVAILCALIAVAHANGPEVGMDAGMIVPVASTDVELRFEMVDIWAPHSDDDGRLECMYVLHNRSSKPIRLTMGYLVNSPSMSPFDSPSHWDDPSLSLTARIADGEAFVVRREPVRAKAWENVAPGGMPDSLPVWDVPIDANKSVRIEIASRISWSGGSDGSSSGVMLTYAAMPARLWAGSIGKAVITFHFGEMHSALLRHVIDTPAKKDSLGHADVEASIKPDGFKWTTDGVCWTFEHWEPEENPVVRIDWTSPDPD